MRQNVRELVDEIFPSVVEEIQHDLNQPFSSDPTKGNNCHLLTYCIAQALEQRSLPVRRELHTDTSGNWHYLIVPEPQDAEPLSQDTIFDLNPWQWRGKGGVILHGPRSEVMRSLELSGAPEFFVALRGIETVSMIHDTRKFPCINSDINAKL